MLSGLNELDCRLGLWLAVVYDCGVDELVQVVGDDIRGSLQVM